MCSPSYHEEQRLVADLTAAGNAYLDGRSQSAVRFTGHERITTTDPLERLRILTALTSNIALNTARTIGTKTDNNVHNSINLQLGLGAAGIVISMLLAWR